MAVKSRARAASATVREAYSATVTAFRAAVSVLPIAAPIVFAALSNVSFLAMLSSTLPAGGRPNLAPS